MRGMRGLRHLDLRNNALARLPAGLAELERLESLDLRANRLATLPAALEGMPALKKLDLRWNKVALPSGWLDEQRRRGRTVYV